MGKMCPICNEELKSIHKDSKNKMCSNCRHKFKIIQTNKFNFLFNYILIIFNVILWSLISLLLFKGLLITLGVLIGIVILIYISVRFMNTYDTKLELTGMLTVDKFNKIFGVELDPDNKIVDVISEVEDFKELKICAKSDGLYVTKMEFNSNVVGTNISLLNSLSEVIKFEYPYFNNKCSYYMEDTHYLNKIDKDQRKFEKNKIHNIIKNA